LEVNGIDISRKYTYFRSGCTTFVEELLLYLLRREQSKEGIVSTYAGAYLRILAI